MSIISLSTTVSLCCDGKHYLVRSRKQFTNLKQEKLKPCGTCGPKIRNSSPLYNSKRQLRIKWYPQRWIAGINESDDKLQTDVAGLPGSPVGAIQFKGFFGKATNTLPPEWGFRGDSRLKYNTTLHGGSDSFKCWWKWEVSPVTFWGWKTADYNMKGKTVWALWDIL